MHPNPAAKSAAKPAASLHVLLAEDNLVNQRVLRKLLERLGHEVTVANDGQEAVDRFHPGAFDVVLLDKQMPRMNGPDAGAHMRRSEAGQCAPTFIVALTGCGLQTTRDACLEAGMDEVLLKPINLAGIKALLERASEHIRQREAA